jgi:GLPGLI family protein
MKITSPVNTRNQNRLSNPGILTKKRWILLLVGVLISWATGQIVFGQVNEGVVAYETKINMHRTLPKERAEMKNMIPEFRISQYQLFFNADESLYKPVEEDEDENMEQDGRGIQMKIRQPFAEMYFNRATSMQITQQEFLGKEYLIEDSLSLPPWKFGTETKKVMGYDCKQAMHYDDERKLQVVAWYAPNLRPFLGPERFNTLPGAVLEVNLNDGERIITAKTLQVRALKKNEIKAPSHGTKTTQADFRKMVEEHTARMRANGADIIIR